MKQIYFVGDSFIGPFDLFDDKNILVIKYKGATAKGFSRSENKNRLTFMNGLEHIKNKFKNKLNDIFFIFNFGQVDVNFSYYYVWKMSKENERPNYKKYIKSIVKKYVESINQFQIKNKYIMHIYPTTIKDSFASVLVKYEVMEKNDDFLNKINDISFELRQKMIMYFNSCIDKYCKKYSIKTLNIWPKIMKDKYNIRDELCNTESDFSIHLMYEPLIKIWLESNLLSEFELTNENIPKNLENTLEEYKSNRKKYDLIKK